MMGGSGGGGGRTPVEAKESGRSKQLVKIVEIISEGEIAGLARGMRSVYLDNTPIKNRDDSYNFRNVQIEGRRGSQVQEIIPGFNTSEKEINVGTQVRKTTPITRTVTDSKVSRLRLTLGVQSLFQQNDQGDTNGASVSLTVYIGNQSYPITMSGKYSSQYLQQHTFSNLPAVPFTVRVVRNTADSKSQRLQNNTVWASYTEIIDTEFTYPNTALIGVKFDSEYFSNIPNRTYDVKGIKVKVPSNYNPITRQYRGMWDGTFKLAWSDNPAWVLYDIVTNKRYGLGQRLGEFGADKWALYQVAQYCDQLVPDGFGGKEPRFTCNAWLTDQRAAYDVINDICSIFRAMPVWNGRELTVVMDRPSDPVWTYTNANVENGEFTYTFSAKKARHNAIQVEYADKDNAYEKTIEYVSDDEAIRKNGLNVKKITAFGCTSRGQAHRTGLWLLQTEKLETKTVTFTVGAEGLMHVPGDIIKVADIDYAGTNIGGRVLKIVGKKVTLDREIDITANSYFTYINAQAKHQDIKILSVNGAEVTLETEPTGLTEYGVWSLTTQRINTQLFRALSVKEQDKGKYTIVALQHEPQKEAIVDNGAVFEPKATSILVVPKVNDIQIITNPDGSIGINADVSGGNGLVKYDILIYKGDNLFDVRLGLKSPELDLSNLANGEYLVVIRARNEKGQLLNERTQRFTIDRPPAPTGVRATGGLGNITLEWDWVNEATATEIFASETDDIKTAKRIAKVTARMFTHEVGAKQVRYYWLRHTRGMNVGSFHQQSGLRAESAVDIDEELNLLNEKLSKNIIDEVFDTAAPARNLELIKTVEGLDVNTFTGYNQVHNTLDGKLYTWNGRIYTHKVSTSDLEGKIETSQLDATLIEQLASTQDTANSANLGVRQLQGNLTQEVNRLTQSIRTESTNLTKKVQDEAKARGTAITRLENTDRQQAEHLVTLTTKTNQALTGLTEERNARIAGDNAQATERTALTARVTAAESGISQLQRSVSNQTTALSEMNRNLNAKIDGINVGGRNYLLDSTFKARKWHHSQGSGTKAIFSIEEGVLTITSENSTWKQYQISDYNYEGGLSNIPDGATVTFSFEVMTPDDNANGNIKYWANLRADRLNLSQGGATNPIVIGQTPAPNQWTRVRVTGVATQPTHFKGWRFILATSTAGTVKFRKPKLELGNIATDWTPAPEDIEGNIDNISANITAYQAAQAAKDKTTADNVTALTTRMQGAEGKITEAEQSISRLNRSTATKISQLEASLNNAKSDLAAKITAEQMARTQGDNATASSLATLTGRIGNAESHITDIQSTKAGKTEVAALAQTGLQSIWRADAKAEADKIQVGGRNLLFDSIYRSATKWDRRTRLIQRED
ncbi:host specificity protein J, partial [Rodentibacter genomosp. 1]|uniref:host specificity protein J n=1 Tax=Rodentibacter genomosp. 1 TaxID=1908264 RepID=UPI000984E09E